MSVQLIILVVLVVAGSWLMSRIFENKDRDPVNGAILGAVCALYWPVLLVALIVAFLWPKKGEGFSMPSLPGSGGDSTSKKLEDLQQMQKDGLITQAEFKEKKETILAQI